MKDCYGSQSRGTTVTLIACFVHVYSVSARHPFKEVLINEIFSLSVFCKQHFLGGDDELIPSLRPSFNCNCDYYVI